MGGRFCLLLCFVLLAHLLDDSLRRSSGMALLSPARTSGTHCWNLSGPVLCGNRTVNQTVEHTGYLVCSLCVGCVRVVSTWRHWPTLECHRLFPSVSPESDSNSRLG